MTARGIVPGAVCGRTMNGGTGHCGMPRLHRGRCASEVLPVECAMCHKPRSDCPHEGCYSLGFERHQDVVTVETRDYMGTETVTRCRRCSARFGSMFIPHSMAATS